MSKGDLSVTSSKVIWLDPARPARSRLLMAIARQRAAFTPYQVTRLAGIAASSGHRICLELLRARRLRRVAPTGPRGRYLEVHSNARADFDRLLEAESADPSLEDLVDLQAPVWVVGPDVLRRHGVTRHVSPFVVVGLDWAARISLSHLPHVVLKAPRPLELAGDELPDVELLIALLAHDLAAATQLYQAKKRWDRHRLLRRLRQEDLTAQAAQAGIPLDLRRSSKA